MLNDDIIKELKNFAGEEDDALWAQGDILNDHSVTKDEIKTLARILQQSPSKLANRQVVAAENPVEQRRAGYSWALYAVFTKIIDPTTRYDTMFARDEWTLAEAKEVVSAYNPKTVEQNKLTHVERASLKVGNVMVKAKLDPKGQLTLHVNLGANRECIVTPQSINTKIVFPA